MTKICSQRKFSKLPKKQVLSQEFLRQTGKVMFGPETPGCGQGLNSECGAR